MGEAGADRHDAKEVCLTCSCYAVHFPIVGGHNA